MSAIDVQQRIAELQAQLLQLQQGARINAPVSGFANVLDAATTDAAAADSSNTSLTTTPTAGTSSTAGPTGSSIVSAASQFIGVPYEWGGESPSTGFDCSGLVQYVFGQQGISLPRVAADQARMGTPVTPAQAQPGDLVFFGSPIDHVGIYAGDGKMVVAPHTGENVRIESVDLSTCTAIRRVLPTQTQADLSWASALPAAGRALAPQISAAAQSAGVDPRLLAALTWSESGFNPSAVSPVGAQGLTQLMPGTAAGLGVSDPFDAGQNLTGGAKYLARQLAAFGGRADLALAAYNAGPSAVHKYGGVPPYAETQNYVQQVLDRFRSLGGVTS